MNGLTQIITKIGEDSRAECDAVLLEAKGRAEEMIASAEANAEKIRKNGKSKAEKYAENEKAKAKSGAELEYKRVVLAEKCRIIDAFLAEALDELCNADDKTYFGYIEKLILAHALTGAGEISFNAKDVQRIPNGFIDEVNNKLCDGKKVVVSEKNIDTKGGFIINYPEMRVDCTFASLIEENADDIKDSMHKALFA